MTIQELYNLFFWQFWKLGYISELVKNAERQKTFDIELDKKEDIIKAKEFLNKHNIHLRFYKHSLNDRKLMIVFT